MALKSEIFEQPSVLERLLASQKENIENIVRKLRQYDIWFLFLAARGTSDHAGIYAQYLWGANNQLPMALATPSLFSIYAKPPNLQNALVVGVSQSGQSPDIISVVEEGNRRGCPTLAITNTPSSPLAEVADFVIDIKAGKETAVAATKTYTAQLMAIAMFSAIMKQDTAQWSALARVPAWVQQVLMLDDAIAQSAQRYRYMDQCVVLGRGYNYATAYEWALKLKELTYVMADSYSSADFQHGPIAVVESGYPVLAVSPRGAVFDGMLKLIQRLANEYKAELLVVSNQEEALQLAQVSIAIPDDIPEWLTPLVSIVPAQLYCNYLALAKGYDTDAPRGLHKVTETL
ncbi:MAG: SIS domain-containing protein [Chloroflexota bacterium]|nr:SIS domain-containing protein [Chloroflexota bacterium]